MASCDETITLNLKVEGADELRRLRAALDLQALYDSEISFRMDAIWDGGFDARLGPVDAPECPTANLPTFVEAAEWLCSEATRRYPNSAFARAHAKAALAGDFDFRRAIEGQR